MSQAGLLTSSGGGGVIPPNVPTTFVTDINSPSVPAGNIENILGNYVIDNNVKGIQTDGSSGGNTITIELTNRFQTSQTFSDNNPHTIFLLDMGAVAGTYFITWDMAAFNSTAALGSGYNVKLALRTDGALGHIIFPQYFYETEEGTMTNTIVSSGLVPATNDFFVQVTGYNNNKINWNLTGTYIFVADL